MTWVSINPKAPEGLPEAMRAVAETIGEAFDMMYFIERVCEVQILAMSSGRPLNICRPSMGRVKMRRATSMQLAGCSHAASVASSRLAWWLSYCAIRA